MIQVFLERYQIRQFSVSRKFRLTENCTVSTNNIVQNSVIKKLLITARDLSVIQQIEQSVIRKFLITE